jgi:hypothetical protein
MPCHHPGNTSNPTTNTPKPAALGHGPHAVSFVTPSLLHTPASAQFPCSASTMAPDLNSVSLSPAIAHQSTSASQSRQTSVPSSRRASQIFPMHPPPLPLGSTLGSGQPLATAGQQPFPPLSPNMPGSVPSSEPLRHPRPMTAAELHLELEKEQEAVVSLADPPPN